MKDFDPEEFLRKLDMGAFDGRLFEVLDKLTAEQREQIAQLLSERRKVRQNGREA
jgi:hypothetical protein